MENQPTISPELVALVDAGDGFAEVIDPATNRVFKITEERRPHPCAHPETDDELRAMLDEARQDVAEGRVSTRSAEEFLTELRQRHGDRP